MAVSSKISLRHLQVDKARTTMVLIVAAAAACLVFSLVSAKALWEQASYNRKVISKKEQTVNQIDANIAAIEGLNKAYQSFVSSPTNIIGGSSTGSGDRDGDNAKITLDAMPSVYDFPGTVTGFNKILSNKSFTEVSMSGKDDEVTQQQNKTPSIVELPVAFSAQGSAEAAQDFLKTLDSSIRPVKVSSLSFSGEGDGALTVSVSSSIYYQPKKIFEVKTEAVQ